MTTMKSLKGIADGGIIPGGRRRNRSCTFFSAFPPFGELRSQSTVKWDFSRVINLGSDVMNGLLMLVMRSNVLRGAYDGRVDLDGHFVTNQTIPFSAIDTAWYGLWNEERRTMEWRKILISKEDRRCSGRVVTGVMEGRVRLPRDPRWGDLATRAYEAVKFEDSDLVVGRVDSLVQHFPEFKRKSEFKGEAWKALHGYITVHLPLDYERQLCPECVHWIDARLNICSECYAEFTSSREIHTVSTWQEREDIRRRRAIEKMKAEAKVDEAKEAGLDEQGDANMESTEKDDDEYASKLTEMVNGAMEESDDIEDGSAFSDPSKGQNHPNRVPKDRIDELLFTNEEIERFAKEGVNINYQEVASVLGDEAAQRGSQATGAYYPNMNAAVGGSIAYSRRIDSPVPGSWIVGDEILENMDTDGNIARMLDGHLQRTLERTFTFAEHFYFPRTVTPEEHYMKMVKTGRRMDTWGYFHRNIPEEERWRDVEKYFPLREDGTPVPLTEEYFDKRYRYLDYLMFSKFLFPIAKRCIEGMVTIQEIESYGKGSGIEKITVRHRWGGQPSDSSIEQQDNFDLKRSTFVRRLLRYTFPEHVGYKYDKLKEGEDPSKILSIPATWVVAANAIGNIGKIHTWDHAAIYLSGHELLPDTLEKLRNFSLYGEEQGRRIPWFISHLATSASILSLGDNPPPASSTDDGRGTGSGRRASSRNPPTPPAPSRESNTAQDRDLSGATKGNKGKSDSQTKGKSAANRGKGNRYDRDDRGWTYSSSSGWRWEDYEYRRGNRGYWR